MSLRTYFFLYSIFMCGYTMPAENNVSTEVHPLIATWNGMRPQAKFMVAYFGIVGTAALATGAYNSYKKLGKTKIGVVTIEGEITDSSKTIEQLRLFFKDETISGIVLKINSGGGAPGASQCIYAAINEFKAIYKKPIVSWVENIAASGAYYIAAATDTIIAAPSALVGSVGVIAELPQLKDFLNQYKIDVKIIAAGDYKATTQPFNTMTDKQEAMYQNLCNNTYKRFVSDVQAARADLADIDPSIWANGQFFDADRGLELNLIDAVGSQLTVEKVIKELTKKNKDILWCYPPKTLKGMFGEVVVNDNTSYLSLAVDTICQRVQANISKNSEFRTELKA